MTTHSSCPKCHKQFRGPASGSHILSCPAGLTHEDLFWQKVDKSGACWLWTGALQRDGYAHGNIGGKTVSSHRYAYEKLVGPIPDGMDLLHSCDVRHCVNPAHLRPGTHRENMDDKMERGRALPTRAKLTEEQVVEIRGKYKRTLGRGGHTIESNVVALAAEYGVRTGTIKNAALGHTWRYIK